jgi:hypothetical protein
MCDSFVHGNAAGLRESMVSALFRGILSSYYQDTWPKELKYFEEAYAGFFIFHSISF